MPFLLLSVSGTQNLVLLLRWLLQRFPISCGGLTAGKQQACVFSSAHRRLLAWGSTKEVGEELGALRDNWSTITWLNSSKMTTITVKLCFSYCQKLYRCKVRWTSPLGDLGLPDLPRFSWDTGLLFALWMSCCDYLHACLHSRHWISSSVHKQKCLSLISKLHGMKPGKKTVPHSLFFHCWHAAPFSCSCWRYSQTWYW